MPRTAKPKPKCVECGRVTRRVHGIIGVSLCSECQQGNPEKYACITKTRAIKEYRLTESDLAKLDVIETDNPHYKSAAPMRLYLHKHIKQVSLNKYGGDQPYKVTLIPFSEKHIQWFSDDTNRIYDISAGSFQRLVADRIDAMGFEVHLVGDVNRKDGGVDIIAYPKRDLFQVPFLLAIQAKHHRSSRTTGVPVVRDFHGVLSSKNTVFNAGFLVTNTSFTPDATWFAQNKATLIRLRDINDLQRWLKNDFANESEWREIPQSIVLAPGVQIEIPRPPKIILPDDG